MHEKLPSDQDQPLQIELIGEAADVARTLVPWIKGALSETDVVMAGLTILKMAAERGGVFMLDPSAKKRKFQAIEVLRREPNFSTSRS